MRVLLVSNGSGSHGGGELFLLSLGRSLAAHGHEVILWASNHGRMDELCRRFLPAGKVYRSPYTDTYHRRFRYFSALADLPSARRIAAEWNQLKPDVIHLNKQNLEDAPDLIWAANLSGIPAVCCIHVTQDIRLYGKMGALRNAIAKFSLHRFKGIFVAVGENRLLDLRGFLRKIQPARSINNGVVIPDLSELARQRSDFRRQFGLAETDLFLVAVGRLEPQKRPLFFLETASKIHRSNPAARFCWIGDGSLRKDFEEEVIRLDLGKHLTLAGWIENVQPYYAAADWFVHVARYEGLPLALLESMAAGLPAALTTNLIEDFGAGADEFAIPISSRTDWVAALQDRDTRRRLGAAARRKAEEEYSETTMGARYGELYEESIRKCEHDRRAQSIAARRNPGHHGQR